MVDRAVERVPDLQNIGLFDQNGDQICGVPITRCRVLNVGERDYFVHYRNSPAADPALFGPIESKLDGRRVLILARALRHIDGRFAGVAVGLLPLQGFEAIVAKASLGPRGVASLRMTTRLTLLARAPALPSERQATQLAALSAAMGDQLSRAPEAGVFSAVSSVDGETRINAYQKLPGYPIYAIVGDAVASSQATWRNLLTWSIGFLLIFAASSLAIDRAVTRSRLSEKRAQALFDDAPCGYHTLDAQGRFLSINATELSWLGLRRDEIVGLARAADFLTDEGRGTFAREFPRLLAGETVRGLEYDLVTAQGGVRRVSVDASPVFDEQGAFIRPTSGGQLKSGAVHERRNTLGLTQSQLAQLSGLSRQTLVGLEAGVLSDLGFNRVAQVLAVLGLDLDPPSHAARSRKRGLWMAAKNASVSYIREVPPDTLGHALVTGSVPNGYAAHLTHLLDEAPVPLVVMAVEEAAANEGVAPKAVWRNVAKLANSLAVHRQGLWV